MSGIGWGQLWGSRPQGAAPDEALPEPSGPGQLRLAGADAVRSWSHGAVTKPETVDFRTFEPYPDGVLCEKVFGPAKDWECRCGKYFGESHAGTVCDRCGVEVTESAVRSVRMGHVELPGPVVHTWFIDKAADILGWTRANLEQVIYFQVHVVADPGATTLKAGQILSDDEFIANRQQHGEAFQVEMGPAAVRLLLRGRRLGGQPAEAVVLDVLPVLPGGLRPLIYLEDQDVFATHDSNDLYRRIINRVNRTRTLVELNAPELILRNENRMLQQSVDALLDNRSLKRPVLGSSNQPLASLAECLDGAAKRKGVRDEVVAAVADGAPFQSDGLIPWLRAAALDVAAA